MEEVNHQMAEIIRLCESHQMEVLIRPSNFPSNQFEILVKRIAKNTWDYSVLPLDHANVPKVLGTILFQMGRVIGGQSIQEIPPQKGSPENPWKAGDTFYTIFDGKIQKRDIQEIRQKKTSIRYFDANNEVKEKNMFESPMALVDGLKKDYEERDAVAIPKGKKRPHTIDVDDDDSDD